jgi:hypothetical protein
MVKVSFAFQFLPSPALFIHVVKVPVAFQFIRCSPDQVDRYRYYQSNLGLEGPDKLIFLKNKLILK